jgi:hypothetical protein
MDLASFYLRLLLAWGRSTPSYKGLIGYWLTEFRYASIRVNYMTIPVYILGGISLVTQVYLSDRYKQRAAFIIGCCIPVTIGYLICVVTTNPYAGYAGMFVLVLGTVHSHSISI